MSTSVASVTSHFPDAENGFTTTTSAAIASAATTVPLNSVAGYDNGKPAVFVIDPSDVNKKQTFTGIVNTSASRLDNVVWTAGNNQSHLLGATVVDYATATHVAMVTKGILVQHNQDGSHHDITTNAITITSGGSANFSNAPLTTTSIADGAVTSAKISGVYKTTSIAVANRVTNLSGSNNPLPWSSTALRGTGFTYASNVFTTTRAFAAIRFVFNIRIVNASLFDAMIQCSTKSTDTPDARMYVDSNGLPTTGGDTRSFEGFFYDVPSGATIQVRMDNGSIIGEPNQGTLLRLEGMEL